MDFYYSREKDYIVDSPHNLTFRELHYSSDKKFQEWVSGLRQHIRIQWKKTHIPPNIGTKTLPSIVSDFRKLSTKPTDHFIQIDDLTNNPDCVVRSGTEGSGTNNFFPTMWQTTDASSKVSIQDILLDKKWEKVCRDTFRRHFKKDGLKLYSKYAKKTDKTIVWARSGKEWVREFYQEYDGRKHYDFWLEPQVNRSGSQGKLTISKKEIETLLREGIDEGHKNRYLNPYTKHMEPRGPNVHIRPRQLSQIEIRHRSGKTERYKDLKPSQRFYIRHFDWHRKIFPDGYKIFGTGFRVIAATNFPPLVAKHLYTTYTEKIKKQKRIVIYDPSSGWGGRIVGACAAGSDRNIHYVGTDPNPDNFIQELGVSRYEYVANFYQRNISQDNHITFDLFQCGSEEIHKQRRFQKYKGHIDLVFTSPPYFNAEGYSTNKNQSSVKFPEYDQWVNGFLRPTLETAVRYLKKGGYLLWNIADVKEENLMMPLEVDSVEILESLGMKYQTKLKYVLSKSPGGGRQSKVHRMPTSKNFASIGGEFRKYEPIFIFRKVKK